MKSLRLLCLVLFLLVSTAGHSQSCLDSIDASTPNDRFVVNGGEVTDTRTGLIWQKCSLARRGADCEIGNTLGYSFPEALQAAEDQAQLTGKAWRLPNVNELHSIVEEKCHDPSINLAIFPDTKGRFYWASTPYAAYQDVGWGVFFGNGYTGLSFKPFGNAVRLVLSPE